MQTLPFLSFLSAQLTARSHFVPRPSHAPFAHNYTVNISDLRFAKESAPQNRLLGLSVRNWGRLSRSALIFNPICTGALDNIRDLKVL